MNLRLLRGSRLTQFAQYALESCKYTPDISQLECSLSNLIFVYGDMQRGNIRHPALDKPGVLRVCIAFTNEPFMVMKSREATKLNPIPIRLEKNWHNLPKLPLRGELYSVPTEVVRELDWLYKNGEEGWKRQQIAIKIPYRRVGHFQKKATELQIASGVKMDIAWTYLGDTNYWLDRFDGGFEYHPITRMKPHVPVYKVDEYYWFTTQEYNE
jgi:hypothetical protein